MESDRQKWNLKFQARQSLLPPEPFLVRNLLATSGQSMLDLASGDGRNAIHFSRQGVSVTAVDISDVGLAKIEERARSEGGSVAILRADLDDPKSILPGREFDWIIINHFKPGDQLWGCVHQWLKPDGQLILCAFNENQNRDYGFSLEFCLKPREFYSKNSKLVCKSYESFFENESHLDGYIFHKLAR